MKITRRTLVFPSGLRSYCSLAVFGTAGEAELAGKFCRGSVVRIDPEDDGIVPKRLKRATLVCCRNRCFIAVSKWLIRFDADLLTRLCGLFTTGPERATKADFPRCATE
jgi:hypothetical protein